MQIIDKLRANQRQGFTHMTMTFDVRIVTVFLVLSYLGFDVWFGLFVLFYPFSSGLLFSFFLFCLFIDSFLSLFFIQSLLYFHGQ